jgi:hypothetical protein
MSEPPVAIAIPQSWPLLPALNAMIVIPQVMVKVVEGMIETV